MASSLPGSTTASAGCFELMISLTLSEVPLSPGDRSQYFTSLQLAIRSILDIMSQDWIINITDEGAKGRRLAQYSSIVIISFSNPLASASDWKSKLSQAQSPTFLASLSAAGFKVSSVQVLSSTSLAMSAQSLTNKNVSSVGLSNTVVVAVSSIASKPQFTSAQPLMNRGALVNRNASSVGLSNTVVLAFSPIAMTSLVKSAQPLMNRNASSVGLPNIAVVASSIASTSMVTSAQPLMNRNVSSIGLSNTAVAVVSSAASVFICVAAMILSYRFHKWRKARAILTKEGPLDYVLVSDSNVDSAHNLEVVQRNDAAAYPHSSLAYGEKVSSILTGKAEQNNDDHSSPSSTSAQMAKESREYKPAAICSTSAQMAAGLYSTEFDEILQLIARAEIDIHLFVDLALNDQLRDKIVNAGSLSEHDRAAVVQLIDSVLKDSDLYPEQGGQPAKLFSAAYSNSTGAGPLSENHLMVFKMICKPQLYSRYDAPVDFQNALLRGPDNRDVADGLGLLLPETKDKKDLSARRPLLEIMHFLEQCHLRPSYILSQECRALLEPKLMTITEEAPLGIEAQALLQLLSKAEINSDLSIVPERKRLLEERISRGPLTQGHLDAVKDLAVFQERSVEEVPCPTADSNLMLQGKPRKVSADSYVSEDLRAMQAASWLPVESEAAEAKALPGKEGAPALDPSLAALPHCAFPGPTKPAMPFFVDAITSKELMLTLLSQEERAQLQLLELRAKTARIRAAIPDWVSKGLVPPPRVPPQEAEEPTPPWAGHIRQRAAGQLAQPVMISSSVRAELCFPHIVSPSSAVPLQELQNMMRVEESLQHAPLKDDAFMLPFSRGLEAEVGKVLVKQSQPLVCAPSGSSAHSSPELPDQGTRPVPCCAWLLIMIRAGAAALEGILLSCFGRIFQSFCFSR